MELKLGQFVTDTSGKTWVIDEIETDTDGEITYWATDAGRRNNRDFFRVPCSITRKGNRGGHRSLLYPHMETYNKERIDWEKIKKGIDNMFPPKRDTASRREWAILHTTQRHQCEVSEVMILTVNVPRSKLRRKWRGLWTTPHTIQTFDDFIDAAEFAASPFE